MKSDIRLPGTKVVRVGQIRKNPFQSTHNDFKDAFVHHITT
jgi:hypothetical protein